VSPADPLTHRLADLRARGIDLRYEGDRLRFRAPQGSLDAEVRAWLAASRDAVIAALRGAAAQRETCLRLSASQSGIWLHQQQAPDSTVYALAVAVRVNGRLDPGALHHALQGLVDRHGVLRTTYGVEDGELRQRVAGAAGALLHTRDIAGSDEDDVRHAIMEEIARPIDLAAGPVHRAVLFTDHQSAHVIVLILHHIAADAWSLKLLLDELLALYGEAVSGRPANMARLDAGYADFVAWQAEMLESETGKRLQEYWRGVLAPPRAATELPTDFPRQSEGQRGGFAEFDLPEALSRRVQQLATRTRTTAFVVMLAGFKLLLARLCGVRDVLTGTPALGRSKPEFMPVVGNFFNTLPVRSRLADRMTVQDFLSGLQETMIAALQAQDYPLPRMVQHLQAAREPGFQPVFNTFFGMLTATDSLAAKTVGGADFAFYPLVLQAGLFDLMLEVLAQGAALHCVFKYRADLFRPRTIDDFVAQYTAILDDMTADPDRLLGPLIRSAPDPAAETLLAGLAGSGIRLLLDGDRLRVSAPRGALDEAARAAIAEKRPALLTRLRAADAFWRHQLQADPPALAPSGPGARPARQAAVLVRRVPAATMQTLSELAGACGATPPMVLLAAWLVLLHRTCGQDDLVIGAAIDDVSLPPATSGGAPTLVPLRSTLSESQSFEDFLGQITEFMAEAARHRNAPPAASCRTRFMVADGPPADSAGIELSLAICPSDTGEYRLRYDFAADLLEPAAIERLHDHLITLLAGIATRPGERVADLPLIGPHERRQLQDFGTGATVAFDRETCLHQQLEAIARRAPERIAVTAHDGTLSYGALDARANRLARHLIAMGLQPGSLVAVCLDRGLDLPVALTAVLKAGCAYLPLDPAHPAERLRGILRDAEAACVLTQTSATPMGLEEMAPGAAARIVRLDREAAEIVSQSDAPLDLEMRADTLAYVIYTSGSTGRPKGVEIEHRNVVAFLEAIRREPGLTADDVLLAVTTVAFDIAGLEIWLPLSVGARLVLATRADSVDPSRLARLMEAHSVSVLQATPATWRLLLASGWAGRSTLRALCGGEALPVELAARLTGKVGALWNMYGPTETTIWSTTHPVTELAGAVPIGRPIAGTCVHVVDRAGKPVPIGVEGELLIGGDGVARGYRRRPDLTARAFATMDLHGQNRRVYRTGDMARFRADGQLDYLGRRDQQIKLRGHRIELGEIEAALAQWPGVAESAARLHTHAADDARLTGYVTMAPDMDFDAAAIRARLQGLLPDYMVPSEIVALAVMPLTPNGKLDRAALPAPAASAAEEAAGPVMPMTPLQSQVVRHWQRLLRRDRVGLHDNFFDLGGHSLLLVQLHAALQAMSGRNFPLVELFARTTVAKQADLLNRQAAGQDARQIAADASAAEPRPRAPAEAHLHG
jgi:amino acid adenylation domain-containing protein